MANFDITNIEYKKTIFLCARRAMLENEIILQKFAKEFVPFNYKEDDLLDLNDFLAKIFDNDMYDVIMELKPASQFADQYNIRFLNDIAHFARKAKQQIMENHK